MELLVRIVDKDVTQPACTRRGDVIAAQPDGWPWGCEELANPDWRIVTVIGLNGAEASMLLTRQPHRTADPGEVLQARAFRLDLTHVEIATLTLSFFRAIVVRVPYDV